MQDTWNRQYQGGALRQTQATRKFRRVGLAYPFGATAFRPPEVGADVLPVHSVDDHVLPCRSRPTAGSHDPDPLRDYPESQFVISQFLRCGSHSRCMRHEYSCLMRVTTGSCWESRLQVADMRRILVQLSAAHCSRRQRGGSPTWQASTAMNRCGGMRSQPTCPIVRRPTSTCRWRKMDWTPASCRSAERFRCPGQRIGWTAGRYR